uniref:ADP-ribosylglycohydrolase family protein n=1 Tax=Streptomyces atriruber TaxID=545121 RepID=UPI000A65DF3F
TAESVVEECLALAKDGTRAAIEAVAEVAARHRDFETALAPVRAAVAPFDTVGPDYRAPSLGSVNYGRDCDSIATMSGAIVGALYGEQAVPEEWAGRVAEASRLDLRAPAAVLTEVAREVFARDVGRRRAHESAFAALTAER